MDSVCLSAIPACYQFGLLLITTCKHFRELRAELRELTLRVEGTWTRIRVQLQFIERIAHVLDEEHWRYQDDIIQVLATKLSVAQTDLEKVTKPKTGLLDKLLRFRYLLEREALNAVVLSLEHWQSRFDPSWFLTILISNPVVDRELLISQERQDDSLKSTGGQKSAFTSSRQSPLNVARIKKRGDNWFIIDRYNCHIEKDFAAQNEVIRRFAQKLASVDPLAFSLLKCRGVVKVVNKQKLQTGSYDFVFNVPPSKDTIQSLRQSLLSGELIGEVHRLRTQLNLVHKNVSPETILLFQDTDENFSTFLTGFSSFRAADGGTNLLGDSEWDRNLYRHPSRQGAFPDEKYNMQHDIYSLGVCMLEIGLWTSFVSYTTDPVPAPVMGPFYQQFRSWLETSSAEKNSQYEDSSWYQEFIARNLKDYFVHLAMTKLPISMGDKYSAVVVTCFTCLDEDNESFGDEQEMADEHGIWVALRFMETISHQLSLISV